MLVLCWPLSATHFQAYLNLQPIVNVLPRHVLESCSAVELTRVSLGIRAFLDDCLQAGRSRATAFKYFIMGFDKNGVKVDLAFHLERGAKLQELTESWLSKWETQ